METVKNDGWALGFVPNRFKMYKLCRVAVENIKGAMLYVPKKLYGTLSRRNWND